MQKPVSTGMNPVASLVTELNSDLSIRWASRCCIFCGRERHRAAGVGCGEAVAESIGLSAILAECSGVDGVSDLCRMDIRRVDVPESWRVSSSQQSHGSLDSGRIPIETSSTRIWLTFHIRSSIHRRPCPAMTPLQFHSMPLPRPRLLRLSRSIPRRHQHLNGCLSLLGGLRSCTPSVWSASLSSGHRTLGRTSVASDLEACFGFGIA